MRTHHAHRAGPPGARVGSAGQLVQLQLASADGEVLARPRLIAQAGKRAELVLHHPARPGEIRLAFRVEAIREPSGYIALRYSLWVPERAISARGELSLTPGVEQELSLGDGALVASFLAVPVPSAAFDAYLETEAARRVPAEARGKRRPRSAPVGDGRLLLATARLGPRASASSRATRARPRGAAPELPRAASAREPPSAARAGRAADRRAARAARTRRSRRASSTRTSSAAISAGEPVRFVARRVGALAQLLGRGRRRRRRQLRRGGPLELRRELLRPPQEPLQLPPRRLPRLQLLDLLRARVSSPTRQAPPARRVRCPRGGEEGGPGEHPRHRSTARARAERPRIAHLRSAAGDPLRGSPAASRGNPMAAHELALPLASGDEPAARP